MARNGPNRTVAAFRNAKNVMTRQEVRRTEREARELQAAWKEEKPEAMVRVTRFRVGSNRERRYEWAVRMYEK